MNSYILGILWHTTTVHSNSLVLRHKDKYFIDMIQKEFGGNARVRDNDSWCISIPNVLAELIELGWQGQNSGNKKYPSCVDSHFDFIRATIETCSSIDMCTNKRPDGTHYKRPRCRIYANTSFIEGFAEQLWKITNLNPKKIQYMNNNLTGYLSFTNLKEIHSIYDTFLIDSKCLNKQRYNEIL